MSTLTHLTFGTKGDLKALYCNAHCARQDGCTGTHKVGTRRCLNEDSGEYWDEDDEGCTTPIYGHSCGYCNTVIWDDEDIVYSASCQWAGMHRDPPMGRG